MKELLTFDDVLISPKFSYLTSRKEVDLSTELKLNYVTPIFKLKLPILSANMDTVTGEDMAAAMSDNGALGVLHRFWTIKDNVKAFRNLKEQSCTVAVSVGVGEQELERAKALYEAGARIFVLDVAHGAQLQVVAQYANIKEICIDSFVIVGNFATAESCAQFWAELNKGGVKYYTRNKGKTNQEHVSYGVDAFKIGIGPGCFAAGTKILMSDGSYKDIEKINLHDKVINKNGEPVQVIGTKFSGFRKVYKYKNNNFYKESYATPDHQHWIGDYSTIKNIQDVGLAKTLDKLTKKDKTKYKWKELKDCTNSVFLLPKKINFELPNTFTLNLKDFSHSKRTFNNGEVIEYLDIYPSYDLGYIFGTFLGDGTASLQKYNRKYKNSNKITKNTCGRTSWTFGLNEQDIAKKLQEALKKVFNFNSSITPRKNTLQVINQNNNLTRLLKEFNKRDKKHLPAKYICNDPEYLKGLYDGLLDSDGCYHKDGRKSFINTSSKLVEQFMLISKLVTNQYPAISIRKPTIGGLTNCNIENCKDTYSCRTVANPKRNETKDYQICRTYNIEATDLILPTYDIEVDCPTSSFIANNTIVHNSACTTRVKTGCGIPQLSAIMEVANHFKNHIHRPLIIADGGMKTSGDIAKALAAGADCVMLGGMLAGTDETPGELIESWADSFAGIKQYHKKYRGSASKESYVDQGKDASYITAEGEAYTVNYKGPVKNILQDIEGGLRSALTYTGSKNIEEFQNNAEFVKITSNGKAESGAHGKK